MDRAPGLIQPEAEGSAICPRDPTHHTPLPLSLPLPRVNSPHHHPQAPNRTCGQSLLSHLPQASVWTSRCMKGWGRQCVDIERKSHWKEKNHRVSLLNPLHFHACSSQNRHTGGKGWHWAVPWLGMGMHKVPIPDKIALGWCVEGGFQTLTLIPICFSTGPWLLQWESGQTRCKGLASPYICPCSFVSKPW